MKRFLSFLILFVFLFGGCLTLPNMYNTVFRYRTKIYIMKVIHVKDENIIIWLYFYPGVKEGEVCFSYYPLVIENEEFIKRIYEGKYIVYGNVFYSSINGYVDYLDFVPTLVNKQKAPIILMNKADLNNFNLNQNQI